MQPIHLFGLGYNGSSETLRIHVGRRGRREEEGGGGGGGGMRGEASLKFLAMYVWMDGWMDV